MSIVSQAVENGIGQSVVTDAGKLLEQFLVATISFGLGQLEQQSRQPEVTYIQAIQAGLMP